MLLHVSHTVHYALPHRKHRNNRTYDRKEGSLLQSGSEPPRGSEQGVSEGSVRNNTCISCLQQRLRPRTNAFQLLTGRRGDGDIVARWQHWSLTLTGKLAVLLTQGHSSYTCIPFHLTVVTLSGCSIRFVLCRMSNADFLVDSTKASFPRLWIFKFPKWFVKCQLSTCN